MIEQLLEKYLMTVDREYEVFVNPSRKEFQELWRNNQWGIRFFIDFKLKKIYMWDGDLLHFRVLPTLPDPNAGNYLEDTGVVNKGMRETRLKYGDRYMAGNIDTSIGTYNFDIMGGDIVDGKEILERMKKNSDWLKKYIDHRNFISGIDWVIKRYL